MKTLASFSLCLFFLLGCATSSPTLPVDFNAPGWQVRQAQAIWQPDAEKPEIAGDLIISTHPNGSAFVQFSKTLPIASARTGLNYWEITFPPQQRHYSGHGSGPVRVVWLQLIHGVMNEPVPKPWTFTRSSDSLLVLENQKNGERLEIHFD